MSTDANSQTLVQQRLALKGARQRVVQRDLEREIYRAAVVERLPQRDISTRVGNQSQATIQRILRRIADDPDYCDPTPAEIIDRRTVGDITSAQMMKTLLNWKYTFGRVVRIGDVATDAYMTGDWAAIEMAFYRGQLTDDEFEQLAAYQRNGGRPGSTRPQQI